MSFYPNKQLFTHYGYFYWVPIYLNLDGEMPMVSGRNLIFDWLFSCMVFIHNTFIEFSAQLLAFLFNQEYEAGFPFTVTGEIKNESN